MSSVKRSLNKQSPNKQSPNKHSHQDLLHKLSKCETSKDIILLVTRLKILDFLLKYRNKLILKTHKSKTQKSNTPKSNTPRSKTKVSKNELKSVETQILLLYDLLISNYLSILKQMVTNACVKEYTRMRSPLEEVKTGGGSLFNIILLFFIGFMTQIKTVNVNVSQNKVAFSDIPEAMLKATDADMNFLSYYPIKEARDDSLVQIFTKPNELSIVQWIQLKDKLRTIMASQSMALNDVLKKIKVSNDLISLFNPHVVEDPDGSIMIAVMAINKDMKNIIDINLRDADVKTTELKKNVLKDTEILATAAVMTAGGAVLTVSGVAVGATTTAVSSAASLLPLSYLSSVVPSSQLATYVTTGIVVQGAIETGKLAVSTFTNPATGSATILALGGIGGAVVQKVSSALPLNQIATAGETVANTAIFGVNVFGTAYSWYNNYPGLKKELFYLLAVEQAFENTNVDTNNSELDTILDYVDRRTNLIKSIKGLKDPAIFDDVEWTSLRKFIDMVDNDNMAFMGMQVASKVTTNILLQILYSGLNIAYKNPNTVIKISLILATISMLYIQYRSSKKSNRTRRRRRQSVRQIEPENLPRIQSSTISPIINSQSPLITVTTPDSPNDSPNDTWRPTDENGRSIFRIKNE